MISVPRGASTFFLKRTCVTFYNEELVEKWDLFIGSLISRGTFQEHVWFTKGNWCTVSASL